MARLYIEKSGLQTSMQDLGRIAHADLGVPLSGPMDEMAFRLANHLMRRSSNEACIELYMGNVVLQFEAACQLVLTGAEVECRCENKLYTTNQIIGIPEGGRLIIPRFSSGQWAYLAMNGVFFTQTSMGSKSFYPGISEKSRFTQGNELAYQPERKPIPPSFLKIKSGNSGSSRMIDAFRGPSFYLLAQFQQEMLQNQPFTLSRNQNRMGIQLEEKVPHALAEMISTPTYPGTVQLTPAGTLIVLMKDAQVTGGYHRVLQLPVSSMSQLAQLRPGATFRFQLH
ncbi:5-oxoprolinase subunit C family protein [Cyclobacterium xiamenense]|uniref:5-oxoprolinase subunit C family protein n=1 Tax=Cyclobacterium xiamenense TaxID=1297121 RepID=UPI0012B9F903|nr:biotin-dependent carboxyltransferase family protein [Cyclobacterium xiamenense]